MSQLLAELEHRLERLDARVSSAPGQLGLDLSAPAPSSGSGGGKGKQCGEGWISSGKECRKTGGGGPAAGGGDPAAATGKPHRPTPQVAAGFTAKPMTFNPGGDSSYDPAAEKAKAAGGVKVFRSPAGGGAKQNYRFRDRQAAEHWYASDIAQSDADVEIGADKRRTKEWKAEFKASYEGTRNMLRDESDRGLLETVENYAMVGSASRAGTATDVRIGGNTASRPIKEGTFTGKIPVSSGKSDREQMIDDLKGYGVNLSKAEADDIDTGDLEGMLQAQGMIAEQKRRQAAAPKAKPAISSQDVTTSKQQGEFARQQRGAAEEAGDKRGAAAWAAEERKVEQARLQAAQRREAQSQVSLFGVTEFDDTMPLFRQRRDSHDRVSQAIGEALAEYMPRPQVVEWDMNQSGTFGRVISEGLLYSFRCDAENVAFRPAWDGINEQQWEHRSEGFLEARYPDIRIDFKFEQKKSKRKCSAGYGCGRTCISMNKECRVTPATAMGKARLRALNAMAMQGDMNAAMKSREVQMQRDATAQKLKGDRQVGKLKKMLEDPRIAEMVRTGKLPEGGSGDQGAPKAGDVRNVKPDGIEVDPERFQYKIGASATGEVGSLSGVRRWDPNLAGVISVWQDPADNKTYVVNGHNRLALARRLGAENVTVRYLDAPDAKTARAIGAKQNIAEGAGSEIDAAKFFRDTGTRTMQQVEDQGLPLQSGKAAKGLAMSRLPEEMFQDVVQGKLRVRQAALIGASGLDEDKQREVYKVIKKNPRIQDETLSEYVEQLAFSQKLTQTKLTLFGTDTETVETGLARADLTKSIKKTLSQEARLLASVSKSQKAVEILQEKGGNVINVGQSQEKAGEANTVLRLFDQLKLNSGPISSALDNAALRITQGESRAEVLRELREQVVKGMDDELRRLGMGGKERERDEAPTMSLFDSDDRFDAAVRRLMRLSAKVEIKAS